MAVFGKRARIPGISRSGRPKPRPEPEAGAETGREENTAQELRGDVPGAGKRRTGVFRHGREGAGAEVPPQMCPWCGKEMERGYLLSGQWIYWQRKRPTALSLRGHAADALVINTEGGTLAGYRTAWRCGACEKMVLDVADIQPEAFLGIPARAPEEDTQAPESNIDHE